MPDTLRIGPDTLRIGQFCGRRHPAGNAVWMALRDADTLLSGAAATEAEKKNPGFPASEV